MKTASARAARRRGEHCSFYDPGARGEGVRGSRAGGRTARDVHPVAGEALRRAAHALADERQHGSAAALRLYLHPVHGRRECRLGEARGGARDERAERGVGKVSARFGERDEHHRVEQHRGEQGRAEAARKRGGPLVAQHHRGAAGAGEAGALEKLNSDLHRVERVPDDRGGHASRRRAEHLVEHGARHLRARSEIRRAERPRIRIGYPAARRCGAFCREARRLEGTHAAPPDRDVRHRADGLAA